MIVIRRGNAKPYLSQVTLVERGGEKITKTLLPYSADSTLTFPCIPPDPNMQDFANIYTRAKIKTLLFYTKVA
jgi:hypothetical protein